jgi:hypothetical protein
MNLMRSRAARPALLASPLARKTKRCTFGDIQGGSEFRRDSTNLTYELKVRFYLSANCKLIRIIESGQHQGGGDMSFLTARPDLLGVAQFAAHAQASAIHQMFLNTSGKSSGSFVLTDAAHVAATG